MHIFAVTLVCGIMTGSPCYQIHHMVPMDIESCKFTDDIPQGLNDGNGILKRLMVIKKWCESENHLYDHIDKIKGTLSDFEAYYGLE